MDEDGEHDLLNGSSVTDGCRVLISNTGSLAASERSDCYAPASQAQVLNPVSGAIDPLPGLSDREMSSDSECQHGGVATFVDGSTALRPLPSG